MISIGSKAEWWLVAESVVPQLSKYAKRFDVAFDEETAKLNVMDKDAKALFRQLHQLWFELPDCKEICYEPYYSLSDLCSEYWLFEANNNE